MNGDAAQTTSATGSNSNDIPNTMLNVRATSVIILSILLKLRETHVDELLKVIEYISEMRITALS